MAKTPSGIATVRNPQAALLSRPAVHFFRASGDNLDCNSTFPGQHPSHNSERANACAAEVQWFHSPQLADLVHQCKSCSIPKSRPSQQDVFALTTAENEPTSMMLLVKSEIISFAQCPPLVLYSIKSATSVSLVSGNDAGETHGDSLTDKDDQGQRCVFVQNYLQVPQAIDLPLHMQYLINECPILRIAHQRIVGKAVLNQRNSSFILRSSKPVYRSFNTLTFTWAMQGKATAIEHVDTYHHDVMSTTRSHYQKTTHSTGDFGREVMCPTGGCPALSITPSRSCVFEKLDESFPRLSQAHLPRCP